MFETLLDLNLSAQEQHVLIIDRIPNESFAEGDFIKINCGSFQMTQHINGELTSSWLQRTNKIILGLQSKSPIFDTVFELLSQLTKTQIRSFNIELLSGSNNIVTSKECYFSDTSPWSIDRPITKPQQFTIRCLDVLINKEWA